MASPSTDTRIASTPLGLLLVQLGRAANRRYTAAVKPIGLSVRQTMALFALEREDAMSQQGLGEELDIDPSNMVALLNDLEDQGLATRRREPGDRRCHVVEMTKRGSKRIAEIHRTAAEVGDRFFGGLDEDERVTLHKLLVRVGQTADLPEGFRVDRPEEDLFEQ